VNLAIPAHGPHAIAFGSRESAHSRPRILLGAPPRRRPAAHRRSTRKKAKRRPAAAPVSAARPCGVARTAPSYQHVVWVLFENKKYADIIGSSDAPYINALAGRCGLATNFFAESHPSLPNYIAMTSGGVQGIKDDSGPSSHLLGVPSIFSQLGSNWRALAESMPSNCAKSDSGLYAVRHNPAVYFTSLSGTCAQQDVPLSDPPDLSAKFTFITPNSCDDMHSCPTGKDARSQIHNGDTWLSQWAPKLLSTPEYRAGNTVIFITWDEDDYSTNQHIATLVLAPSTPSGTQDGGHYDHYSLLRTTEDLLHLPPLGSAAGASSMRAGFHL
jgi:phosphatidylinositol-3-phosphatase